MVYMAKHATPDRQRHQQARGWYNERQTMNYKPHVRKIDNSVYTVPEEIPT